MMRSRITAYVFAITFAVGGAAFAQLAGPGFDLRLNTIDGGGGTSTGGGFELTGTIGQPDAGRTMSGGTFSLRGGFWAAQAPVGACCLGLLGGQCEITSQGLCEAQGGVYQGDGTVCAADTCVPSAGNVVEVEGGETCLMIDLDLLANVGLALTGISEEVSTGCVLEGPDSLGFLINPRVVGADLLPTTFAYVAPGAIPFEGAIEHLGTIFFNDTQSFGDFTVAFDPADDDPDQGHSGFTLASEVGDVLFEGGNATRIKLFHIALPLTGEFGAERFELAAQLLIHPDFAEFLGEPGLVGLPGMEAGQILLIGLTGCSAVDVDNDGEVDRNDLIIFIVAFATGDDLADFDGSGDVDGDDLVAFLVRFVTCQEVGGDDDDDDSDDESDDDSDDESSDDSDDDSSDESSDDSSDDSDDDSD